MISAPQDILGIIVQTILESHGAVLEITGQKIIGNIWIRPDFTLTNPAEHYIGKGVNQLNEDDFLYPILKDVDDECYPENRHKKYPHPLHDSQKLTTQIFNNHPIKGCYFLAVAIMAKAKRKVEKKWKTALDAVGDGMWEVNFQTGDIQFSHKWQETFGYDSHEIQSFNDWEDKVHPDDRAEKQQQLDNYLNGNAPLFSAEVRYRKKDGTYRWILSRGIEVSSADKKIKKFIGTHADIHEKKIAEAAHASTLQLLTALIDNLQEGVMVTDEHGKVVFTNPMFCSLFNYGLAPNELTGIAIVEKPIERQVDVFNEVAFVSRLSYIVKQQKIVLGDEFELADGRTISRDYIPLSLGVTNKNQIWKFRDVTAQRNISKQFRKQREFYERILNHIPTDIVVFDSQHNYLFVNPAAVNNKEKREWLIGKNDFDYCAFFDRPIAQAQERHEHFLNSIKAKKTVAFEEKVIDSNGFIHYHLRNMFPIINDTNEIEMVIGYGLDITNIKLAEEALKTSVDTFSSAFHDSAIGMSLIAPDGRWVDVNQAICDIIGYDKTELLQMHFKDVAYPADADTDTELLNAMIREEIKNYSIEKRYITKNKSIVWVNLTVSIVWNTDKTPKFYIAQIVNINTQKQLTDEIKYQNQALETARLSLINKISQLEEMTHMIGHNLRGPINNIKLVSESLITDQEEDQIFTPKEGGELIHQSAINLSNTLNNLLEVSQIKLNNNIPYNDCDIAELYNEVTNQLLSTIFQKRITIKTNFEVETIKYPRVYFESILYNLLSNAIKYSSTERPPEILVATTSNNNQVQLKVKDNGIGIDLDKHRDSIFKLNKTFHEGFDSKGVGLFITKTQIETLGGSIMVSSEVNKGTEFIVTL